LLFNSPIFLFVFLPITLGGFYLLEARDLNDAIQAAQRIPSARYGSIEVRPIMTFSKP